MNQIALLKIGHSLGGKNTVRINCETFILKLSLVSLSQFLQHCEIYNFYDTSVISLYNCQYNQYYINFNNVTTKKALNLPLHICPIDPKINTSRFRHGGQQQQQQQQQQNRVQRARDTMNAFPLSAHREFIRFQRLGVLRTEAKLQRSATLIERIISTYTRSIWRGRTK